VGRGRGGCCVGGNWLRVSFVGGGVSVGLGCGGGGVGGVGVVGVVGGGCWGGVGGGVVG